MLFADHRKVVELIGAQVAAAPAALDPAGGLGLDRADVAALDNIGREIGQVHRAGFQRGGELQQQLGHVPLGRQAIATRAVQLLERLHQLMPEPELFQFGLGLRPFQFGDAFMALKQQRFEQAGIIGKGLEGRVVHDTLFYAVSSATRLYQMRVFRPRGRQGASGAGRR